MRWIFTPRVSRHDFHRNFMLVIGPISSLFDFLTFYVMLVVLQADEKLFQTGWFVESLCTQVLVIFIIRTRGNPLKSRATSPADGDVAGSRGYCRAIAIYAARNAFWICAAPCPVLFHPRRNDPCLSCGCRTGQAEFLPMVSSERTSIIHPNVMIRRLFLWW